MVFSDDADRWAPFGVLALLFLRLPIDAPSAEGAGVGPAYGADEGAVAGPIDGQGIDPSQELERELMGGRR